jgi:hypothetical protein
LIRSSWDSARKLFAETEAEMKPLPADERQPFAGGAGPDDIVDAVAYAQHRGWVTLRDERNKSVRKFIFPEILNRGSFF